MVDLPDGETILKIRLFVFTQSTNVTDRQTDTQIHRHRMTAKDALDGKKLKNKRTKNKSRSVISPVQFHDREGSPG